jgi:flagellar biosynthetic protein FlhB
VADESRTEQATPRRREKAREKGQVVRSRELPAALVLLVVTVMIAWHAETWLGQWRAFLAQPFVLLSGGVEVYAGLLQRTVLVVAAWAGPPLLLACLVAAVSTVAQGGLVLAPTALSFNPGKLNPATNLGRIFSLASLRGLLKSLLPTGYLVYLGIALISTQWDAILRSSFLAPSAAFTWLLGLLYGLVLKGGLVFAVWFLADYLLERMSFERQLRMSRQEIREELKETEGHPMIRSRLRRLQRQLRRRRMLQDVKRASVVVTNPTEYAVALEYRPEEMAAPVVVAKGRNLLAQRIKHEAHWQGIPIIENPPLAQALYRSVEIGQAIPAKLYAAVAEILAFIYRLQGRTPKREQETGNREQGKGNRR